jgi:5-(carboxyamino)imidazole ribonucleotide synthase
MNLGILGGGQLGRMLALAGYPLGIQCRILEPARESSAAQVAPRIQGEFEDYRTLFEFASGLDAVTYEFENVPVESARWLADRLPVFPPPAALAAAQDRIAEKSFFAQLGIPVPPFAAVNSREELSIAQREIGLPAVLKTTRFGYDGKGQAVLRTPVEVEAAWEKLGGRALIWEGFIPFERELSIIGARGRTGEIVCYPLVQNEHRDGMLRRTTAPAPSLSAPLQIIAEDYARRALSALNYVGVLAIELFEWRGQLLVNEMAPRVHNSGHWTIEGAATSQFENHVRAVLGLPLGSTQAVGCSVMLNALGELPSMIDLLAIPGVHFHNYGKTPRANRKVGHVTICGASESQRAQRESSVRKVWKE